MTRAEIITIGDEILIGQIVDTNSAWLGRELGGIGVKVWRITSIADDREEIVRAVDTALRRSEVTIVTGGLGPTKDDLTKYTLAEYFGGGLVLHEESSRMIQKILAERGIPFNELNRGQAMVPRAATILITHNGTAPGMVFEKQGHLLASLPGVPFEMKALCTESLFPLIQEKFRNGYNVHKTAITFGLPESMLATRIEAWENALPEEMHLAYLPNPRRVRLRLSVYDAPDKQKAEEAIDREFEMLRRIIPGNFLGYEEASIQSNIARLLTDRNETLSTAESCTGGAIASAFTAMAGASQYYRGGVVSYSNDMKVGFLGVKKESLTAHGAVSREVVEQMAEGIRLRTGSDYAIATSGIAGPTGGTPEKPVGTVWMAIGTPEGVFSQKKMLGELREQNIEYGSNHAMFMLYQYLTGTLKR